MVRPTKSPDVPAQMLDNPERIYSKDYLSALKAYWEWRPRTCLERLTTILTIEDPRPREVLGLYRLWIEVLAELREVQSLHVLKDHLSFQINSVSEAYDGPSQASLIPAFTGLKGLIHLELDEIEAANLLRRSLSTYQAEPYVWELSYLLRQRFAENKDPQLEQLFRPKELLTDYFHLKTYAVNAQRLQAPKEEKWAQKRLSTFFPGEPLEQLSNFHHSIDEKDFVNAVANARSLVARFPLNIDYAFHLGYALVHQCNYVEAITALGRIYDLYPDQDLDVVSWFGCSLARQAIVSNDLAIKKRAEGMLQKACAIAADVGLPAQFPLRELERVKRHFMKLDAEPNISAKEPRYWLCRFNAKQYHKIRSVAETYIEQLEARIGGDVREGDVCFVFGEDYGKDSQNWRFGALYRVEGEAVWHPQKGYTQKMRLINRPAVAIPVPTKTFGNDARQVFELPQSLVDAIALTIAEWVEPAHQDVYANLRMAQ